MQESAVLGNFYGRSPILTIFRFFVSEASNHWSRDPSEDEGREWLKRGFKPF